MEMSTEGPLEERKTSSLMQLREMTSKTQGQRGASIFMLQSKLRVSPMMCNKKTPLFNTSKIVILPLLGHVILTTFLYHVCV